MPHIRIYRFPTKSQPPSQINKMLNWFNKEVSDASVEPVDSYRITKNGPVEGSEKHLSLAIKMFNGLMLLKKEFVRFKKRR